ncbi:MAG TPA: flagellar motor protein MotB [Deltaproteobacteria bacterium]|nr:flagellar motor protein MotB [Deltaproteobacteria bacterium]
MAAKDRSIKYVHLPRRDGWMVTLTDLSYMLLTFFVLIMSMSSMNDKAFKDAFGFLNQGFGVLEFPAPQKLHSMPSPVDANVLKTVDVATLTKALNASVAPPYALDPRTGANKYYDVRQTPRGLAIALNSDLFFDSGSARLNPEMAPVLAGIAKVLKRSGYQLAVEGHTDAVGDPQANVMLSLARAQGVLDTFVYAADMSPRRFSLAGYGPFLPRMPNDTEAGRAKNRRVEVVLLKNRL